MFLENFARQLADDRVNAVPAVRLGPSFLVFIIVAQLRFELRILARVKTLLLPGGSFHFDGNMDLTLPVNCHNV